MSIRTFLSILTLTLVVSCTSTKKSIYFRGVEDMSIVSTVETEAPVIQKNDLLDITVSSLNPNASQLFNSPNESNLSTTTFSGTITKSFGYLVDEDGFIQFPILGNIKAAGITQKALKDTIQSQILQRKLLLDPIISVRFLNFKVTVMGEVARPSVYNIPNEKITLLEALTLAGDLTVYSKRDNVLLIREENGKKNLVRLDLSSAKIFDSPYYNLKSNDIVYVEHNRAKVANTRSIAPWLSAIFSGTSLIIVIIDRIILN